MLAHTDGEYVSRTKDAVRGSAKLRNAILRSLGYRLPRKPRKRLPAPTFERRGPGRPIGSTKPRIERFAELDRVQRCVSRTCRVRIENLRGYRKAARFVRARQLAMYVARKATKLSYTDIGRHFGRDHTTIIHGVSKIQALVDKDDAGTLRSLRAIEARLNG